MTIPVILYIIFTMAFSRGVLILVGVPAIIPKSVLDLCILFLFVASIQLRAKHNEKYRTFGLMPLLGFFIVSCVSYSINGGPAIAFLLFCRHIFIFYIFFLSLVNLKINHKRIYRVTKFVIILFLIQIPANFVKFLTLGQREGGGIGTMSQQAGSLTTIFVLFAIGFCLALYLFKKKKMYILAIIGFFLFGLIGNKRAIAFYIPVLVVVIVFFYIKRCNYKVRLLSKLSLRLGLMTVMISGVFLFCAAKMIPSLNREQKIGGKFEFSYLMQVARETTTWRAEDGLSQSQMYVPGSGKQFPKQGNITLGRYVTTERSFQILKDAGPVRMLFGMGTGSLIQSRILNRGSIGQITLRKYDIKYGITGFVWTILQVGLLGAFLLVLFYVKMFKRAYKLYHRSQDRNYKAVALGFLSCSFVFLLDYFTYSRTVVTLGILTPVYFYIAFILFKGHVAKYKKC